jgi:hypothetical protein
MGDEGLDLTERNSGSYNENLKKVRVSELFAALFIFFEPEIDYHHHVSVWGLPFSALGKEFSSEQEFEDFMAEKVELPVMKKIGGPYCLGFNVWSCDCGQHQGQNLIGSGWCPVPRHLVRIDLNYAPHPEGKYKGKKVLILILKAYGAVFEIYDKPNNVGMVIIKPVPIPLKSKQG